MRKGILSVAAGSLFTFGILGTGSRLLAAVPPMAITEWMYNGLGTSSIGEYVEFTNTTASPIDMTGWNFDDSTRSPGSESLSGFGTVQPSESVIFTDDSGSAFRTRWGLPASVKIIGGNTDNLGRSDEINLYDNTNTLVDRLTYNDQGTGSVAGPRTNGVAGGPNSDSVLGTNTATSWSLMTSPDGGAGDPHNVGTIKNSLGEIGNPGSYFAVPEPGAISLLLAPLALMRKRRRA